MAILELLLDWCIPLNIRNMDYLICIFSYSFKIRTRFAQYNKLMHLFQLRSLMKIYIHNFMVLLHISCFMDLALQKGACKMADVKNTFQSPFVNKQG